ncbi:hypothetical protein MMC30_000225 [Trapelia coarctata]|nr:hypothetical protein [Trapelia coarctata]
MLILIAGITGNLGQNLAHSALSRGHQVRGLGRSPSRLPQPLLSSLESFVTSSSYYDIPAIECAVANVDAIVAAYANVPGLTLEGQLILLRAAERAGVRRYVSTSWNFDWTKIPLGKHESYDEYIMFKQHVELSSSAIKPIYIFTGVLAEFMFHAPSDMTELPEVPVWNPKKGTAVYYGDGKVRFQWTTFRDTAEYTIEIVTADGAEKGGCYSVMSDAGDVFQIAKTWKEVTGKDTKLIPAGDVKGLEELALAGRKAHRKDEWKSYIGPFYWLHSIEGAWDLDEDNLYTSPRVHPTKLKDFFEMHKDYYSKF